MRNTQHLICGIIFFGLIVSGAVKITQSIRSTHQQTAQKTTPQPASPAPTVQPVNTSIIATAKPQAKIVRAAEKIAKKPKEKERIEAKENPTQERLSKIQEELAEAGKHNRESYDQPDEAAAYYRLKRLPAGEKEIPVERYFAAKAQMDAMPQYSSALGKTLPSRNEMKKLGKSEFSQTEALGNWTSLGPGNIGGRTRGLLIHPTSPSIMYAAGVAGGVWKSTNGGGVWQPLTDLLGNLAISCLAFDPNDPNIIYAGTGEGFYNSNAIRGAGIMKSTDAGASWQQIVSTSTSDFYYVNDLVISKTNTQHLYAATRMGIRRSLDGGATWTAVLNYLDGCFDLAIRTDQATDYIFAACGTFSGAEIFRNTDAGGAGVWTSVQKETGMGRTSLAIASSNQNVVYALSANTLSGTFRDGLFAVFRSTNSGDAGTWIAQVRNNNPLKLNTILLTNPLGSFRSECGLGANSFSNQGWYDNVIAVDPLDANRVWAGGIDLFRSDDGGLNWGIASYWWPEKNVPQYAHADQHAIVFHPNYNGTTNKQMFVGNDGGIFRTDDARAFVIAGVTAPCNPAASGVRWTSLNNNYGVTQFYHGAVFPDGKSYFGGTQDNGTLLGSDTAGANGWREIYGGDGGYVAIDPTTPNAIFISTPFGRFRKSTDGGLTFGAARLGIQDVTPLFITPLTQDTSNSQVLWTGAQKLWRTTNGGGNWVQVNGIFAVDSTNLISAIAVAPTDSTRVVIGRSFGWVHTITDALSSANYQPAIPRNGFVSWVTFDPINKNTVYATYSTFGGKHIYRSLDGGINWNSIDANLPDIPVHCLLVDPKDSNRLFSGTDLGVFVSTDGGMNWAVENTGFANAPVESLAINSAGGTDTLYAFTHGRGVWRISLGASTCNFSLSQNSQNYDVAGGTGSVAINGTISCGWSAGSNVDWVTINSGQSGQGNSAVSFTVNANNTFTPRIGTITIAQKSFIISQAGKIDRQVPLIQITSPRSTDRVQSNETSLTVQGTVFDEQGIVSMGWVNNRGGGDSIYVTNNQWSAGVFNLQTGANLITISALDESGNVGTATIRIDLISDQIINAYAGTGVSGSSGDGGPALAATMIPYDLALDKQGNLYISDIVNCRIRKVTPAGIISTVAGNGMRASAGDGGLAINAQLAAPWGIGTDSQGNVYLAEGDTAQIRKIDISTGIISTVVTAQQGNWLTPRDVAIDKNNNLYVADYGLHHIQKVTPGGVVSTFAGGNGGFGGDGGLATSAFLNAPSNVVIDGLGNVVFVDSGNARIRRVTTDGIINSLANYSAPACVAADSTGNIFFTIPRQLTKIKTDGTLVAIVPDSSFGSANGDGGSPLAARVSDAFGVAVDNAGSIFVVSHNRVRKISTIPVTDAIAPTLTISSPTTGSTYATTNTTLNISGTATDNVNLTHISWKNDRGGDGIATGTSSWVVNNIALQSGQNNISVVAWDSAGNASTKILSVGYNPDNVFSTLAGTRSLGFNLESGTGLASQLYVPETVALDNVGNLYIADKGNHRIRKVTRSGLISTVAGNGQLGSSGDGGLAINASMNQPNGVAVDSSGNLYISDTNNNRIRKVNSAGIITTIAGTGINGFSGDGGQATQAQLDTPVGITLDSVGNLLIADAANHRIRKLNLSTGIISTIAGNGYGFGGDGGQATQAQLNFPTSVAIDQNGNLYISDTSNNQVRKVTAAGIISRFAGTGFSGFSGDGGQANLAQFSAPGGLTVDAAGNLYVTDQNNHRVRKIALDGTISTVAGNGNTSSPTTDEGGTALNATLNAPAGVAVDALGNMFIADTNNHRVVVVAAYKATASVNAANYLPNQPVAVESVVAAFGANLATRDQAAAQLPLPTEMAGTSVKVRDSKGVERLAPLFYVGKSQVNYQIPAGTASGFATVIITNGNGEIWTGAVNVVDVQPGVFSATSDGGGLAAASILFIKGGQRTNGIVANCGAQGCAANPIDVNANDEVYLEMYGTGIRKNSGLSNVTAMIGGVSVPVLYAGAHCCYFGVDQVNLPVPKSLAGRGAVDVVLSVDGKVANRVTINVK